jgi:TonB family protein
MAPDAARLQQALFGAPQLIRYDPPDSWDRHARKPPDEIEQYDVEIELTVNADGSVGGARVVTGGGDERLANQALRAAETARYRPRLVDGQPADTPGVRLLQPFYVLREAAPPAQGGGG